MREPEVSPAICLLQTSLLRGQSPHLQHQMPSPEARAPPAAAPMPWLKESHSPGSGQGPSQDLKRSRPMGPLDS